MLRTNEKPAEPIVAERCRQTTKFAEHVRTKQRDLVAECNNQQLIAHFKPLSGLVSEERRLLLPSNRNNQIFASKASFRSSEKVCFLDVF